LPDFLPAPILRPMNRREPTLCLELRIDPLRSV
jgi:hypothetical protein